MAYERQYHTNGDVLEASHLNHMEAGIKENSDSVSKLSEDIADIKQNGTGGSGITTAIKDALLNAFAHVAWIDENGQSYYDALSVALNSSGSDSEGGEDDETTTVTLSSISATYNGGEVTSGTKLADLTDIVVTATYSDGSTKNITTYELSGEIVTGENTITVSYGGLTTTFIVVATENNRTYLTYGEHIAYNMGDTNVVKYSDDGETSVTYNQSYAHVVIENIFDHDVDVHFKYTHGGDTIYRNLLICSVDVSDEMPEDTILQSKPSYNFGVGAPRNAYNCKNLNDYYIEGQGTDYTYTGNVYEGIYTLKAGCMLLIISGSNNMTSIDNDNSYFSVEE